MKVEASAEAVDEDSASTYLSVNASGSKSTSKRDRPLPDDVTHSKAKRAYRLHSVDELEAQKDARSIDWKDLGMFRLRQTLQPIAQSRDLKVVSDGITSSLTDDFTEGGLPGSVERQIKITKSALGMVAHSLESKLRGIIEAAMINVRLSGANRSFVQLENTSGYVLSVSDIQVSLAHHGSRALETLPLMNNNSESLEANLVWFREKSYSNEFFTAPRRKLTDVIQSRVDMGDPSPALHAHGGLMHNSNCKAGVLTQSYLAVEGVQCQSHQLPDGQVLYGPMEFADQSGNDEQWAYKVAGVMETVSMAFKIRMALRSLWVPVHVESAAKKNAKAGSNYITPLLAILA
eukprot:GHVH01003461.1.p1 GENE.GHVH01003461.1~~GHVH01003461.1.p1  ORF type:complete len:347 (+),score=48.42 GHVH01003461.1:254-1294(+)